MDYLDLKFAMKSAEEKYGLRELDLATRDLLHTIAHENARREDIRVSDFKELNAHGTPPTIVTRLNRLVEGGWIIRREDKQDRRVVLLSVSPKARSAFQKISRALEKSYR